MRLRRSWWGTTAPWLKRKSATKKLKAQAEQGLADQKAAEAVESKIKAIGEVEYTEASRGR